MPAYKDEKTGKWMVQCYYENWKGEWKNKKKRGFQTKKEAIEWERDKRFFNISIDFYIKKSIIVAEDSV